MLKRTVLIVDDQLINRRILGKLLAEDYELLYAENGKEAMKIMQDHADTISAVLLDIVMPEMDGYAVLEQMGKDPRLSKIPVIVSSQMEGEEAEVHALSLGAQDFIAKPYKADIIRHRLGNIIRLRETAAIINRVERDELTGLYNKHFFIEKVEELLRQNEDKKYDLLCFDVERFKLINDIYGTTKGDEVLCQLADLLQSVSRDINICGRFSADKFYTILPHKESYTEDQFQYLLKRINQLSIDMDIHIHCGVYVITDTSIPVSTMCDRVELAADKNKGNYSTFFTYYDESIRKALLEEQFIISSMQTALEEHQFQVYYQPKYDLTTEMVAGAEALVRWIHPQRGFLSPGSFVPLFERNGFITQLDQYVWERVCRDVRNWMDAGYPPVAVSVNVSRADLYNPKLTHIFLGLIAKYRIPIQYLHLEITESAYTDNPEQIIEVVNKLRKLGFVIEMDDFGSGYSSLNMLAEMPVDVLKLDMKFIQNESQNVSGKGILSFVISLAKWLDLAVIAEGVETSEQIASLRSMDCNYVQGFYYAKPMERAAFEDLLLSSKTTEMVCTSRTAEQYVQECSPEHVAEDGRVMLIVDDIEVNRAVLASAFLKEYRIVERENGKTAWEYLEENYEQVAVVMLDLLMPVMDGFQLLGKIRSDTRTSMLPVIITSQGDADSEEKALYMKADDFISKPYKTEIIHHRVNNVMANYELQRYREKMPAAVTEDMTPEEQTRIYINNLKPHFDLVRLVDPRNTIVCQVEQINQCDIHSCYSVWGKHTRCNNCISMRALEEHGKFSKLEYSEDGLHFVISEYVPYQEQGAVIEMVTRLEDQYVDNIFDKELLYLKLDKIHQQLEYDELTGVYNRRYIEQHLEIYVQNARKYKKNLGIAMLDIDSFKNLNDTHGHLTGDSVLKQVAQILESNIALSKGDFVARYGGDEFMILCWDIAPEVFRKRILAVTQLVKHIMVENNQSAQIGISAGCICISEFPELGIQDLIRRADERLYKAKKSGRGRVVASDTEE
ncbi:MAG: EAL domain-containing protein [Lachnospiraceae bacterium]|nr:EAL domain-containing protein [Lachnospiraceae bacterium]